jgi:thioesterase domain-containing protein
MLISFKIVINITMVFNVTRMHKSCRNTMKSPNHWHEEVNKNPIAQLLQTHLSALETKNNLWKR